MGFCNGCGSEVPASNVDQAREIATCAVCGKVIDLRALRARRSAIDVETTDAAPRPVKRASAGWVLVPFLMVPALIWFMVHTFTSEVEGSLDFGAALGTGRFAPQECASGQLLGFMGVELREGSSGRQLRLMRDELGRAKLAVLEAGKEPVVLTPRDCAALDLDVVRTSTVTNDVYLMEGHLVADCPALRGRVTFERCGL